MSVDSSLEDHEVLGSEFCSGYVDKHGKWNNGFYCPSGDTQALYCCGTPSNKYCCARREHVAREDFSSLPLLLGVVLGIISAVTIVTLMSCCFCSCCILYKKRQPTANGGPLYRLHCSSTASGVANMYSFSNQNNLAGTPIDTSVLVDLEPMVRDAGRATIPRGHHTFSRDPETAPRPDVLGNSANNLTNPGLQAPEPPPPYDSPASYALREHIHLQQIKHQQLPQPPQHPPPLPPGQQQLLTATSPVQNSTFNPTSSLGSSVGSVQRQSPPTLSSESLDNQSTGTFGSPESSQDTSSASGSPRTVIRRVIGSPKETVPRGSSSPLARLTSPVAVSRPLLVDTPTKISTPAQSGTLISPMSPSQHSSETRCDQTVLKGPPSVLVAPQVRGPPSGPPPPVRSQTSGAAPGMQNHPIGGGVSEDIISLPCAQPTVASTPTSLKSVGTEVLYHSTKF